jgi:hypothetical protein
MARPLGSVPMPGWGGQLMPCTAFCTNGGNQPRPAGAAVNAGFTGLDGCGLTTTGSAAHRHCCQRASSQTTHAIKGRCCRVTPSCAPGTMLSIAACVQVVPGKGRPAEKKTQVTHKWMVPCPPRLALACRGMPLWPLRLMWDLGGPFWLGPSDY